MSKDHAEVHVSKRQALFTFLSDLQWHYHYDLARVAGVRYSARILELKRLGFRVESKECEVGQGKMYRMPTTRVGDRKMKRVKVFLEEEDVLAMVAGHVPSSARAALRDAHGSFDTNREKL